MKRLWPFVLLLALGCAHATAPPQPENARALHEAVLVVDTHADTPSEYLEEPFDLGAWNTRGHLDYPRMKAGGLDAEFFAAYVPARYEGNGAAKYCFRIMEVIHEMVERYPQLVSFARSTNEIRSIVANGKQAILIGIEGGHAIEDSLELLGAFYRFGARYMTLTHTNTNNWADSSGDAEEHGGLTEFGREVVREMNRIGMLVDVSHVSDQTFFDVIETTGAPVIASHSSARALADVKRNMSDEMLRAVGRNGGVVMVNFYSAFLSSEVAAAREERQKRLEPQVEELRRRYPERGTEYEKEVDALMKANPLPPVSYTIIVDHIEHVARIAGVDHVGLGSDFDGVSALPTGMEDVSKLPAITEELKRRGWSDANVRKVLGENFMRVFAAVERVAAERGPLARRTAGGPPASEPRTLLQPSPPRFIR